MKVWFLIIMLDNTQIVYDRIFLTNKACLNFRGAFISEAHNRDIMANGVCLEGVLKEQFTLTSVHY